MRLHTEKSKDIGSVVVHLGLGDMTEATVDAYIVPQFQEGPSEGGVGGAICRAGGQLGVIDEYEGIVQKAGGSVEFGKAFVTSSHGGNSRQLIHVASVGSGIEREYNVVNSSIYNALVGAKAANINSIVSPVLGTGIIGALTDDQSARAMLSAVRRFDAENPGSGIQITFVAYGNPQNKNHPTFQALKRVLAEEEYVGATPVVGQREFDPERWVTGMNRDLDLGTTPQADGPEPSQRKADRPGFGFMRIFSRRDPS
jgi:O-acetyl-ADP-ribose deacetylase (regulator of RNase III)